MSVFSVTLRSAAGALKALLAKVMKALPQEKRLSIVGDVLAIAIPFLSKEHMKELGDTFCSLDQDRVGIDDKIADVWYELGGRADLVVADETAPIEMPPVHEVVPTE